MAVQVLAMVIAVIFRTISDKDEYKAFEEEEYEARKEKSEQQVRGTLKSACAGSDPGQ